MNYQRQRADEAQGRFFFIFFQSVCHKLEKLTYY